MISANFALAIQETKSTTLYSDLGLPENREDEDEDGWICAQCSKNLRSEPKAIGCDVQGCDRWFHPSCVTGTTTSQGDFWQCHLCHKDSKTGSKPSKELTEGGENIKWGDLQGENLVEAIDKTYEVVVSWQRNSFKLPSGKAGKLFLQEMATLFDYFNSGSSLQPYAMKMIMIFAPLMLQKPSKKLKVEGSYYMP